MERRCSSTAAHADRDRCPPTTNASGQPWVLRFRRSYGLAQGVKVLHPDSAAFARIVTDFFDGNDMLMLVAPRVPDEDGEGADQAENGKPPDVPDDGEAADCRKEGDDDSRRRIHRHFDWLVIGFVDELVLFDRCLLARPIGFLPVD